MVFRFSDAVFYLASGAAQVWSALMVFHILLVRDLKSHVESEINSLWNDAKLWWPNLLVSLKRPEGLRKKLSQFGLSHETVLRADTHKNSFIRLIAAIKTHRIIGDHMPALGSLTEHELSHEDWQLKFEPIAERIQELDTEKLEVGGAFLIGIAGITLNMVACCLGSFSTMKFSASLLGVLLVSNLVLLYLFGSQVRKALTHFNVTAHHEPIAEQIVEVENAGH